MIWFVLVFLVILVLLLVSLLAKAMGVTANDAPLAAITACLIATLFAIVGVLFMGGAV